MTSEDENLKLEKNELTRRQWILRLGGTAILVGFSGVVKEAETEAVSATEPIASALAALPPGLYEPSNDHLSHALSSDSRFHPILQGTETDYVRPHSGPYEPQAFSVEEFSNIRRIVELILGEIPDSPNASARGTTDGESSVAEVAEWIDLVAFHAAGIRETVRALAPEHRILAIRAYGLAHVERMETADPQKLCREGLEWLENESRRRFGGAFLSLREPEQIQLLRLVSDDRPDQSRQDAGTRFFQWIKAEIIRGFYTSRAGLNELDYKGNSFNVESPGCRGHDHSEEEH